MRNFLKICAAACVIFVLAGCSGGGSTSGHIGELETFTVVDRETVVLDMPTINEDGYETSVCETSVYEEPQDNAPVYDEETDAWSDTYDTAPVPDARANGEGYLGGFTTADGTSDIYFYDSNGQRCYYGTIYGVYYEGTAEVYESHGAIYCLDGSKNDGTVAVSFYMSYNEANEMSPYELYEQVYGTGFYWHHQ